MEPPTNPGSSLWSRRQGWEHRRRWDKPKQAIKKMILVVLLDFGLINILRTILNCVTVFQKAYSRNFLANWLLYNVRMYWAPSFRLDCARSITVHGSRLPRCCRGVIVSLLSLILWIIMIPGQNVYASSVTDLSCCIQRSRRSWQFSIRAAGNFVNHQSGSALSQHIYLSLV